MKQTNEKTIKKTSWTNVNDNKIIPVGEVESTLEHVGVGTDSEFIIIM